MDEDNFDESPYADGRPARSLVDEIPSSFLDKMENLPSAELEAVSDLEVSSELASDIEQPVQEIEVSVVEEGSFMDRLHAAADVAGNLMEAGQAIVDELGASLAEEQVFNKGDRGL